MAPRRRAVSRNMVLGHSSFLRWDDGPAITPAVSDDGAPLIPSAVAAVQSSTTSDRSAPYSRIVADIVRRPDMPVGRNVRRGSAVEALSALREQGAEALVEELLADRVAKSGVASSAS